MGCHQLRITYVRTAPLRLGLLANDLQPLTVTTRISAQILISAAPPNYRNHSHPSLIPNPISMASSGAKVAAFII